MYFYITFKKGPDLDSNPVKIFHKEGGHHHSL